MCGIAGLVDFGKKVSIDEGLLAKMAEPLRFRGPDEEGFLIEKSESCQIGFAHKRLSIIDLSPLGRQPMVSTSGKTVIVFNGEIYNYKSIKQRLIQEGWIFHSNSDTEVLLVAYEAYGIRELLDLVEGMFAFAVWDKERQKLFLARDRFGEKPLYYHWDNNFISFSSDIRSFNALNVKYSFDLYAIGYYFQELSTPSCHSIWNEIKKLPPAHFIEFNHKGLKLSKYWDLDYKQKLHIDANEAVEETERLLRQAVSRRLVADVPVGTFLSGGIDSSLISLFAAEEYGEKLSTFSVGFNYETFNELPYAKIVAKKIQSNHHEIILDPSSLDSVNNLISEYGEPFADSSMIPTYYLAKFAAKHVKVALGGDGGDEVFAGYRTYNQGWRMQQWQEKKWLRPFVSILKTFSSNSKIGYIAGIMENDPSVLASALHRSMGFNLNQLIKLLPESDIVHHAMSLEFKKSINEALSHTNTVFDALLYGSIKTRLPNDYFVKTDRAAMFASLELRTSFMDRDLVEFTASLPHPILMHKNTNKFLTKKIAEKYFSHDFVHRNKMGFALPIGTWIKNEWKEEVGNILFEVKTTLPFNQEFINQLWQEHSQGKFDHTHRLWAVYVFKKWCIQSSIR